MIFVTVGGQLPFDRMVRALDEWAGVTGRRDLFAQVGPAGYRPVHIAHEAILPPVEFRKRVAEAAAIVSHAGMGTIITALELGRPILVLPRRAHLGETRNDHQVATAERLAEAGVVLMAQDEKELVTRLEELEDFHPETSIGPAAETRLLRAIREYALGEAK